MAEPAEQRMPAPRDLPSPPALLSRVMRLATDPSVGGPKLAAVVSMDPAFAAEVVRTSNAPFYGAQTQVTTLSRAIMLLGGRNVRSLAICFAARDVMRQCGLGADDLSSFWEDALRRAVAARRIARRTHLADPEEAFAAGLLLEFGLIALFRAYRWHIPAWASLRRELPDARRAREAELFGATHDKVAAEVLGRWGVHAGLLAAIAHHHEPKDAHLPREHAGLAAVAGLADAVAAVFTAAEPRKARDEAVAAAKELGLSPGEVDGLLQGVPRGVEESALALGLRVRPQATRDEVLEVDDRHVAALQLSYEELTVRLDAALRERDALAAELADAKRRLETLELFDPLTGLATRAHFEDCLRRELAQVRAGGGPLSVVLLELDRYRQVVDEHGGVFGDTMVRLAAQVVLNGTRTTDLKGRLEPQVLAVLLPGADETPSRVLAERLRSQVSALSLRSGPRAVHPACSIGGCTLRDASLGDDLLLGRQLLDAADQAMDVARRAGGNRVVWAGDEEAEGWG